jgi:hypothetical protein
VRGALLDYLEVIDKTRAAPHHQLASRPRQNDAEEAIMTTAVTRALRSAAGAPRAQPQDERGARRARMHEERGAGRTQMRLVALAGLASFDLIVVATLVAPALWNAPGTTARASEVNSFAHAHAARSVASLFIYSLAMGLFMCFTAGVSSWLRGLEPEPRAFSSMFAFGALALAVLVLAAFAPAYLLSYRHQPASIAGPLADLTFALLALSGIPTAVCLAAYATLVARLRCLPQWTAWLAAAGAVTHVLIAASLLSHGSFMSLESPVIVWVPATFFLWILAAGAALLRARPAPA